MWNETIMQNMHANMFIAYADAPVSMPTGFDPSQLSRFQFLDVALFWCVTRYSTTFSNGIAKTTELASHSQLTPDSLTTITTSTTPASPRNGSLDTFYNANFSKACYSPGPGTRCIGFGGSDLFFIPPSGGGGGEGESQTHAVDHWTALAASYLSYFTLSGGLLQTWGLTTFAREGDAALALSAAVWGDRFGLEAYPPQKQMERMERVVGNMARGLSNGLRVLAGGDAQFVRGRVLVRQTVVAYDERWLAWLAVQLGLVTGVLGWTVCRRGKVPVMKDSVLALVDLVGRADGFRNDEWREQDELEMIARGTPAILKSREGVWGMVPDGRGDSGIELERRAEIVEPGERDHDGGRAGGRGDAGGARMEDKREGMRSDEVQHAISQRGQNHNTSLRA